MPAGRNVPGTVVIESGKTTTNQGLFSLLKIQESSERCDELPGAKDVNSTSRLMYLSVPVGKAPGPPN